MNVFTRRRALLEALAISAVIWLGLAVALRVWGPHPWPWNRPGNAATSREDVALFCWIVEFLLVKSWLMFARTRFRSSLGLALIAANVAFAVAYLSALLFLFWPAIATDEYRQLLRATIAAAVTWGAIQLALSEDLEQGPDSPWVIVDALRVQRDGLILEVKALETRLIASQRSEIASLHAQIDAQEGATP